MIIILSVLLTASICANIFLGYALDINLDKIETYQNWFLDIKKEVSVTYSKLKDLDDKQMFEKDDDVGFVFSEIVKLIEKLKERTE
jgi:hypothetical protein